MISTDDTVSNLTLWKTTQNYDEGRVPSIGIIITNISQKLLPYKHYFSLGRAIIQLLFYIYIFKLLTYITTPLRSFFSFPIKSHCTLYGCTIALPLGWVQFPCTGAQFLFLWVVATFPLRVHNFSSPGLWPLFSPFLHCAGLPVSITSSVFAPEESLVKSVSSTTQPVITTHSPTPPQRRLAKSFSISTTSSISKGNVLILLSSVHHDLRGHST